MYKNIVVVGSNLHGVGKPTRSPSRNKESEKNLAQLTVVPKKWPYNPVGEQEKQGGNKGKQNKIFSPPQTSYYEGASFEGTPWLSEGLLYS